MTSIDTAKTSYLLTLNVKLGRCEIRKADLFTVPSTWRVETPSGFSKYSH